MLKLFFLLLFAGGWALSAAALHVVRTPANVLTVTVLPKNELSFDDTYVDTREWTMQDVPKHNDLVRRLITTGKSDVVAHVADPKSSRDVATQLADALNSAPAAPVVQPTIASKLPSAAAVNMAIAQFKASKVRPEDVARLAAGVR